MDTGSGVEIVYIHRYTVVHVRGFPLDSIIQPTVQGSFYFTLLYVFIITS